ncbi:hypothetical protein ACZ11_04820 [Lysinibacillus xylanilyticus]|uniref:Uncharacterized protein n=1 Tax=Lysinibacillus xylanilyticus TaxID=582475 RepID=A0A0K9FBH1_9BACI|nr:hypothetical protein [Lysinibacillus xylanilyticus]KMY31548.1 hypothetical protein ACZ11_04820 [Lysinibacillus xylanilyticus]
MTKNNTKSKIIVAIITLVLLVAFSGYFIKIYKEKEAREELEALVESKEWAYESYIDSINNMEKTSAVAKNLKIIRLSWDALDEIENNEEYKKTNKGNEHLDKLKKEAIENMNNSFASVMKGNVLYKDYTEAELFADEKYITKENMALYHEAEDVFDRYISAKSKELKESLGEVKTGHSEDEVKLILGSPNNIFNSDEAEFWTYDDMVLTMKDGYVFDITNSN